MVKNLKVYQYGNPALYDAKNPYPYWMSILMMGEDLREFWDIHVKRYFNRSKPATFTKSGQFRFVPLKPPKRSALIGALKPPYMDTYTHYGQLVLRTGITSSSNPMGNPIDLIDLLQSGAGPSPGTYNPFLEKRMPQGTWKGFPASYWMRWHMVFETECMAITKRMISYINTAKSPMKKQRYTDEYGNVYEFDNIVDVVEEYNKGQISSVKPMKVKK